jgi:hypothetical protein
LRRHLCELRAQQREWDRGGIGETCRLGRVLINGELDGRKADYGDRFRTCKKGTLTIRTFATPLRLNATWYAPATTDVAAFKETKKYRT